jgi:serine/threonine-protein kinase
MSPLAVSCARRRAVVFSDRGQCVQLEEEARRMVAADPVGMNAYEHLASALAARGAPIDSIRQVLRKQVELIEDPVERRGQEQLGERWLALYTGDLDAAETHELAAERAWEATDPSESVRNTLMLFALYDETTQPAKALALSEDYMRHLPALTPDFSSARPAVIDRLRRAGRLTEAEYLAKRDAWVAEQRALEPPLTRGDVWTRFHAYPARSEAEAREALAALPGFEPQTHPTVVGLSTCTGEPIGRVYLLAGRIDEAIPHLRAAAGSCRVLACFLSHVQAEEELGEALAARGDTAGACASWQGVLDVWGHAKPRSRTADRARALSANLGCGR